MYNMYCVYCMVASSFRRQPSFHFILLSWTHQLACPKFCRHWNADSQPYAAAVRKQARVRSLSLSYRNAQGRLAEKYPARCEMYKVGEGVDAPSC